jgi:hypothetical protein
MSSNILSAFVLGATLAIAGCTPIESHGEFVPAAPYAELHTFSFATPESAPSGYHASARSAAIVEQMKPLVAAVLERKGYRRVADGEGDIIFACGAGRRDVEEHIRLPWRIATIVGEEYEDRDFVEGGIIIDAFDRNGGQIWHGAARTEIDPNKPSAERLQHTVEAALSRFPAHPAPH